MKDQFYLTLPSNSSYHVYPNNTTANYITHLNERIKLKGSWEVSLVEFHYPQTISNIYSKNNVIYFVDQNGKKEKIQITGGFSSSSDIIRSINNIDKIKDCFELTIENHLVKVNKKTNNDKNNNCRIIFHPDLAFLLGFETDFKTNFCDLKEGKRPPRDTVSIINHIYVYCDVVESQFVGDTRAPLLRIIHVDKRNYEYGSFMVASYENPHYLPVLKNEFETIEIDLRDDTGRKVPFSFGSSVVKLHFRKCSQ